MPEFRLPVRVYYEDTDAGGFVYHGNYIRYMERARTEWLRALGFEQDELLRRHGVLFAVRRIAVEYLKPARLDEQLEISVRMAARRNASVRFAQAVYNQAGRMLCQAEVDIACIDAQTMKPRRFPKPVMSELDNVD